MKNKIEHTRGPWESKEQTENTLILAPEKDNGWQTVLAVITHRNDVNFKQNASLIAAAPEMLDALFAARNFIEDEAMHLVTTLEERMANIRAFKIVEDAIRKATVKK